MSAEFFGFSTTQAKTLQRLMGSDDAGLAALAASVATLQTSVTALQTSVTNLNAWATGLATKLNADAVAQNALSAFPLTMDTNYDTTPQITEPAT